jgi:tetratricopeptide (TPR) repeat protein
VDLGRALLLAKAPLAETEAWYRQGLALRSQLVKRSPDSFVFRLELACAHAGLTFVLAGQDRRPEALRSFRRALALLAELSPRQEAHPEFKATLGSLACQLGVTAFYLGELKESRRLLEETVARESALPPAQRSGASQGLLKIGYEALTRTLVHMGEHKEAARRAEELVRHFPDSTREHVQAAGCFLGCAVQAEKDSRLAAEQRRALATAYADRSVALLRAVLHKGGPDDRGRRQHLLRLLQKIPDLDRLRTYPNLRLLLRELEKEAPQGPGPAAEPGGRDDPPPPHAGADLPSARAPGPRLTAGPPRRARAMGPARRGGHEPAPPAALSRW